ncbi:uncharacterized protein K444DRAFT_632965 [Hyaloscypha bicolor E]|uniref:Uncharacterized protein n=1 Tax=Hyaloscypha bicolor E TaxID=1095630 RepID=A0A2J6T0N1_9HELO|nr:uncharacterized protein K444DRAFT_632965 [Hyaloscypha bicolor E]PMD56572.1 hypothetical protein K444DRAFT_632965 [Hyaloscypha bicolor E]
MQCLGVLHTDASIGLHGSGRCEGRGRRRDRELRVFVGGRKRRRERKGKRVSTLGRIWWYAPHGWGCGGTGEWASLAGGKAPPAEPIFSTEGRAASDQDPEFYIWGSRNSRLLFTSLATFVYVTSAGRSDEQPNLCSTRIVSISSLIVFWHYSTDGFSILPSAIAGGRPVSAPAATSMATALAEGKPSQLDSHRICQIAENACQDGLTLERQTRDVVGGEATCSL